MKASDIAALNARAVERARDHRTVRLLDGIEDAAADATMEGRVKVARTVRNEWTKRAQDLTPAQRVAIASGARATQCRRSLFHFLVRAWPTLEPDTPFETNWHHKLLCNHVQGQLVDWKLKKRNPHHVMRAQNAVYNFPPGTTKSRVISVKAPAWMWIDFPSWSVLCLSANPTVATRDASFTRDIVVSDWYRTMFAITWDIRDDADAKSNYKNTVGGSRVSLGITSRVVGARADCIIIDDANDMYEVFSESSRREVNGKIDHAIWNRVNDQRMCVRMEMQQRGHVNDASGHLISKLGTNVSKGGVMHVPVPMEYDPTLKVETPFGYDDPREKAGEPLHPIRFTKEFREAERVRLGTFGYEAQYNQKPAPLEGNLFKRDNFRFFRLAATTYMPGHEPTRPLGCQSHEKAPAFVLGDKTGGVPKDAHWTKRLDLDWMMITIDASFGSTSQEASQVGLGVVGGKKAARFVFEDRTAVMDTPSMFDAIDKLIADYPAARRVLVERKANGNAIIQMFQRKYPGFIGCEPEGGKVARANAMAPAYESGNVMLLDGSSWLAQHVEELALFNRGPYDDRVDMMSQLMTYAETKLVTMSAWDNYS